VTSIPQVSPRFDRIREHQAGTKRRSTALKVDIDGYRFCLLGLTIISVSRIHMHFSVLAALRPGLLLVGLAGLSLLLNRKSVDTTSVFRTWPAKVMLAFGLLACFSAPLGISLGSSASFILSDYSKTLLFAFLVIMACRTARDLYTLVWGYVIGSLILAWMALFLFKLSDSGSKAERLGRLYAWDANDVGVLMVVGLALTLVTLQTAGRLGKAMSAVTLLAIGITIARTGSRGAFLGTIGVGIVLLFGLKGVAVWKRVGFVLVTGLAVALFAPRGYWDQMATLTNPTDDYNWSSQDGRMQVAQRGMGYMLNHPIAGLGINNFSKAECLSDESEKVRNHVEGTGIRCTAPHNSYVQAGAELGVPGLLLWVGFLVGGTIGMFRLRRRMPEYWATGTPEERFLYLLPLYLAVGLVGFSISSLFVSFAWLDLIYFVAALMAGLYTITRRQMLASASVPPAAPVPVPVTSAGARAFVGSTRSGPPRLRRSP
jgi:O-antigen ligase